MLIYFAHCYVPKGLSGFICCSLFQTTPLLPKAEQLEKKKEWIESSESFMNSRLLIISYCEINILLVHLLKIYRYLKLHIHKLDDVSSFMLEIVFLFLFSFFLLSLWLLLSLKAKILFFTLETKRMEAVDLKL